ncbi:MAG TPA: hypothetical protein VFO65_01260, partial [Acidimicrobiales bacterium]|nr:hypothetical protein [Acidimicrobiales bacterium]
LADMPRRTVDPGPAPTLPSRMAPPPATPAQFPAPARAEDDLRMPEVPPSRVSWSSPPPAPAAPPERRPTPVADHPAAAPAPAAPVAWTPPAAPVPPSHAGGHTNGAAVPAASGPAQAEAPADKADQYQQLLEKAAAAGLVRRVPKASLPQETDAATARVAPTEQPNGGPRIPDDVRNLLSTYRSGVSRGRSEGPAAPTRSPAPTPRPSVTDSLPPLKARVRPEAAPAPTPDGADADPAPTGLVRRVPRASLPADTGTRPASTPATPAEESTGGTHRLPEDVRNLLSSYRSGVRRGRFDQVDEQPQRPSPDQPQPPNHQPHPSPQEWS